MGLYSYSGEHRTLLVNLILSSSRVWNNGRGAFRGMIRFDRANNRITAKINEDDIVTMDVNLRNFKDCWEGLGLWVDHMIGVGERSQWEALWGNRSVSEIFGEIVFQWLQ